MSATVADFMTTAVVTIGSDTGLKEAANRLRSGGFSALPVVDALGRVVGVLSEADVLARGTGTLTCHRMSQPPVTARPDTPVAEAAHLMHRHGLKRLPVVDDAGRPVGIVSRADLLRVFLRSDEELGRDVRGRLRAEGKPDVTFAVEDGVITLSVAPDDRRTIEAVEAVDGVVAVRGTLSRAAARRLSVNARTADIEILGEEECLDLLRSHSLGRIAVIDHGQPLIFPVNYAADARAVVFRTAPGMKLAEAPMTKVAFEIDEVDEAAGTAWSVMVQGVAYEITEALDRLSERLRELVVEPLAPGERKHWVAVMRHGISGRRFRLASPL